MTHPRLSQLLEDARSRVPELDPAHHTHTNHVVIDIRERDELASSGTLPDAHALPRGFLELQIHTLAPTLDTPLLLVCASGTRSLLAARALIDLGYTHVRSLAGGFQRWKHLGLPVQHPDTPLSPEQLERYSRHLRIPEIGEPGQRALLDARVALIGAGGLGSPAGFYLAAAGIGALDIIDPDVVDRSNLQRQILHTDARVGTPKTTSAIATLSALNPDTTLHPHPTRLNDDNARELLQHADVILDGTDNFSSRYTISRASLDLQLPHIHGAVYRFDGQLTTFDPRRDESPCYRCLHPEPPPPELTPDCTTAGVLGVLPGVIGLLQALEAIKLITGVGTPLIGRLLTFDGLASRTQEFALPRSGRCPGCGQAASA